MAAVNECIAFYEPGGTIAGHATTAVIGKRCVAISGNRQASGNISIAPAAAAGRILGVATYDGAVGAKVPVICQPGIVVPIRAEAAIAAFAEVEVGTAGQVITKAAGVAIGFAITAAVINTDAQIKLY